jgi:hypothetical protein
MYTEGGKEGGRETHAGRRMERFKRKECTREWGWWGW